jgi:hypothetical protein
MPRFPIDINSANGQAAVKGQGDMPRDYTWRGQLRS